MRHYLKIKKLVLCLSVACFLLPWEPTASAQEDVATQGEPTASAQEDGIAAQGDGYAKKGFYIGLNGAYNNLDGDVWANGSEDGGSAGEVAICSSTDCTVVPEMDGSFGWGITMGGRWRRFATELNYTRSKHDSTFAGFQMEQSTFQFVSGDVKL